MSELTSKHSLAAVQLVYIIVVNVFSSSIVIIFFKISFPLIVIIIKPGKKLIYVLQHVLYFNSFLQSKYI